MRRGEFEALYGGAAGGGKSDALVCEALRQVDMPWYKGLILRKTFPQLKELIEKSLSYYKAAYPTARYNASEHKWTFPSGAKIYFGSMQNPQAKTQYQGLAFDYIAFDEITHFTYEEYDYMKSRCRPNGPGTRCYIRCTGNPGGIGHAWVKERFVTSAPPMTTIWASVQWTEPSGIVRTGKQSRVFVPSTVFDNKALLDNDPQYVQRLASLNEADRNALLYGDWDSFRGMVFTEWINDSAHYHDRRWTHVIEPFAVPKDWAIWCAMDWGYSKPFAINWYAVDHRRNMYAVAEYYGCTGEPNVGVKLEPAEVAKEIKRIESEEPNLKGRDIIHRVGDPAIWGSQTGESIGDIMERQRVYFERGDNSRIDGKMQIHHRLAFDDDGRPSFQAFTTCHNLIRTIPTLIYDASHVEDVETKLSEDHVYDELRYVCMKNPIAAPIKKAPLPKPYNPLDTDDDVRRKADIGRYDWYML